MNFVWLYLLGITVFVELLILILANPDGFININCGASEDETAGDDLLWVSDSPFINVSSRNSSTLSDGEIYLPFRSISYFTDLSQKKNCYLIPVKPDVHYLVRTRFDYGRFNSEKVPLASVFDLLIGGIKWITPNLTIDEMDLHRYANFTYVPYTEIIVATKSDRLSFCLARNSQTIPDRYLFISTILLRPLEPSMYATESADFNKSALVTINRKNFGGEDLDFTNYRQTKSDPYSRVWDAYPPKEDMDLLNTSDYMGTQMQNQVPQKVLQTAVATRKIKDMDISDAFVSLSPGSYSLIFYFCNINLRATTGTSTIFNVHINDEVTDWVEFKQHLECIHIATKLDIGTEDTRIKVFLRPFNYSASGPFINGAELYKILDLQNTHQEDVLAIWEIAEALNVPDDWARADPCLPSGYESTGITCNKENPPRVIIINLTNRGLVGNIPASIGKLTALTQLLLGNNRLSGPVPDLSHLNNLTKLYLQNNNLTGNVPRGLVKNGLDIRVDPQINFPAHKRKSRRVGISVGCSLSLVLIVICTAFIWRHKHRSELHTKHFLTSTRAHHSSTDVEDQTEYRMLAIEYTEDNIKAATNNYSTVIGKGSFGSVFYGRLSGSDVAVKVLSTDSNQGQLEFHNELTLLSRIHHKNLVNLVGYCRQPVVALVYEYMQCGSLKDHLYGVAKLEKPLDWYTRLNIALQAAEGLLYLHHGCNPPIIHRDIKCSNILLDRNMCAKVADFGLSKLVESSNSHVSTVVKGTFGYMDPEYHETSALTEKSDVYSFGVVLLEILSGITPRDGIVESGRKLLSCGRMVDLIDTSLGSRYNLASAWRVAEIAYGCTEPKSIDRPKMVMVVKELQEAAALLEEDVNRFRNISITPTTQGYISNPSIQGYISSDVPSAR